jgi:hypothetical protein
MQRWLIVVLVHRCSAELLPEMLYRSVYDLPFIRFIIFMPQFVPQESTKMVQSLWCVLR